MLIDAGTYGASALLLARVLGGDSQRPVSPQRFLVELREGFSEVRSRTWAWSIIVVASFVNTIGVAFPVLGALVAKQELGGAGAWAAILVSRAVGLFAGGAMLLRAAPRRPLLAAMPACATAALPALLLAVPAPLALIVAAALIAGAGSMVFNTLWETTLQQYVPVHARSRVSSHDWFGSLALQPIGYALIGPFAGAVDVSTALYLCGMLEIAAVGALLGVKDVRRLGRISSGEVTP